jgi:hypothetical protein
MPTFAHPHLPAAFPDDTEDTGMGHGRADAHGGFVDRL